MNNSLVVVVLASGVLYGTPLLYAALGELLAERSGVLNLRRGNDARRRRHWLLAVQRCPGVRARFGRSSA